jgi:hypothetical protein
MKIEWILRPAFVMVLALQVSGQEIASPAPNRGNGENIVASLSRKDEIELIREIQPDAVKRNLSSWYGIGLTQKDKLAVAMNPEDVVHFADFLQKPNSGFVRLYDASGCEMNLKILNVADECPPNIRGRGIFYSFRRKKYQSRLFSDVKFYKNT